jgi:excisionase family DNA binding protein
MSRQPYQPLRVQGLGWRGMSASERQSATAVYTRQQLYRIPEAMRLLSLSRSVIYEQIRAGRLKSVTQGRTRLVPATAIIEYVELLVREADGGAA